MTFDLFGYGKYSYTFEATCREVPGYVLADGATRVFLNTRGTNKDEVSAELIEFLHYLEHTADEIVERSSSERIRRIHRRVCEVKNSEEAGVKYMQAWEEKYYEREEGRQEGREEGRKEGREEGREANRISLIKKKILKEKPLGRIAEELEENPASIQALYELIKGNMDKTDLEIADMWNKINF